MDLLLLQFLTSNQAVFGSVDLKAEYEQIRGLKTCIRVAACVSILEMERDPILERSISSSSAWYRGGRGTKSLKERGFVLKNLKLNADKNKILFLGFYLVPNFKLIWSPYLLLIIQKSTHSDICHGRIRLCMRIDKVALSPMENCGRRLIR